MSISTLSTLTNQCKVHLLNICGSHKNTNMYIAYSSITVQQSYRIFLSPYVSLCNVSYRVM